MLKVVVIDGNAISRGLLNTMLTNGGHEVIGGGNVSSSSIARMVKLKPQLICMDLGQVEDDKMAVLDNIRKELPKTIVFLVSNSFDAETIKQGQEHGVRGFIVKPFNSATVLTSIRTAVLTFVREIKQAKAQGEPPAGG
ncbi:ANTAR domain-containing response regulator [Solimicrobium silvestre]|uniref:Response regulator receiver domain n=1 Tax=Solimicrobium silvestre TaxID=2099400 RepID=A0A2S9GWV8_9BURK|nr:response regulator [Solimicrobium silvestre]PRC92207.1 Response regulator receiver domain [Solimicrobium silvestre]